MRIYLISEHWIMIILTIIVIALLLFPKKHNLSKILIPLICLGLLVFSFQYVFTSDILGRICVDNQDNVYIASKIFANNAGARLMKFDSKGNKKWDKRISQNGDNPLGFRADIHGNLYLASNNYLLKLNMAGDLKWTIKSSISDLNRMQLLNNQVILMGTKENRVNCEIYDFDGSLIRAFSIDDPVEFGYKTEPICMDFAGNIIFKSKNDPHIKKYDGKANLIWKFRTPDNYTNAIATDKQNNIYFAVYFDDGRGLMKLTPEGKQIWTYRYSIGVSTDPTTISDIIIDDAGNAYLTGIYWNKTGKNRGENAYVLKLSNAGKELWRQKVNVNLYSPDPGRLAIDTGNNAYLAVDTSWSAMGINLRKIDTEGKVEWENITYNNRVYFHIIIILISIWGFITGIRKIIKFSNDEDEIASVSKE